MAKICKKIPYRPLIIIYLFSSAILRLALWIQFGVHEHVRWERMPFVFCIGAIQDLFALLFLLFPLSLLTLLPSRIIYSRFGRNVGAIGSFLLVFGAIFLLPMEYLFFDEFTSRFNLVAVDYFAYPTEVVGNIWESYPIVWLILGIVLISSFIWYQLWPSISQFFVIYKPWKNRFAIFAIHLLLVVAFLFFGSINFLVANQNRIQSQISQNGILTFFEALYTNDIDYNQFYSQIDRIKAFQIMRKILKEKGGEFVSEEVTNLTRKFPQNKNGLGKMNIVIIGEESLGAQYIGALGDQRNLTPNFDRISNRGLLFENAFATGTRTVRGLEAISLSLPPIPSESTVKRPGNENMANIGQLLDNYGYKSSFIYGGFGAFDNMNYFFGHNGFNLSDRFSVDKITFSNIWGICDEDLFNHSIKYYDKLSKEGKPFLSIIMTTSNHKPFTFRAGIPNIPQSGGGREAGVRYADYALGEFFKAAEERPWFQNTIFIVVGDHDSRVYGRAYIPVERFRIAMMILAPGKIAPRRIENVTSQIDIIPTIMGLLGFPYEGPFYGRDILASDAPLNQPVLLNHNHDVGIFLNNELSVTSLGGSLQTFRYTSDNKTIQSSPNIEMQEQLSAYLQTAYELYREKKYKLSPQL